MTEHPYRKLAWEAKRRVMRVPWRITLAVWATAVLHRLFVMHEVDHAFTPTIASLFVSAILAVFMAMPILDVRPLRFSDVAPAAIPFLWALHWYLIFGGW